ncbi:hypothetical protein FRC12_005944 [Ceratobasidium sp. 428]|nr:hypothetical protein FRC12_005944 [Ceratobasidium sp. 428]
MSSSDNRVFIHLPTQARPGDRGPFHTIHRGVITGVYPNFPGSWPELDSAVLCAVAVKELKPRYRETCKSWNQAVWYANKGYWIRGSIRGPRLKPDPRKIQPLQVLSQVFPPGSVIVLEPGDVLLPADEGDTRPITVSTMVRAGAGLSESLARTTSIRNGAAGLQLPSRAAEDEVIEIESSKPSSPVPTLVESLAGPSNDNPGFLMPKYHPEARVFPPALLEDILRHPRHIDEDPVPRPPAPNPSRSSDSSQVSGYLVSDGFDNLTWQESSSHRAPSEGPSSDHDAIVQRELGLRLRLLEALEYSDPNVEQEVFEHLLVALLESARLPHASARRVRRVAAELEAV